MERPGDGTLDLETLDVSPRTPKPKRQPRRSTRPRNRVALALGLFVAAGLLGGLAAVIHARGTTRSVAYCLSAPLKGKLAYTPAKSHETLGWLRGDVGGFPVNDAVEAALLRTAALPTRAYLDNGTATADVLDDVGFRTDGQGSHHLAEAIAVDSAARVEEIVFRAWTPVTHDLRAYGTAAHRC